MATVYLGLGSNLGNRQENIARALGQLLENHIIVEKMSTVIETDPVGGPPQGKFLNAVLRAQTDLPPHDLLMALKSIEEKLGRVKTVKDGPRLIDVDILLYDRQKITTPELTIPHPQIFTRDFVMKPLEEIAPELAKELSRGNN